MCSITGASTRRRGMKVITGTKQAQVTGRRVDWKRISSIDDWDYRLPDRCTVSSPWETYDHDQTLNSGNRRIKRLHQWEHWLELIFDLSLPSFLNLPPIATVAVRTLRGTPQKEEYARVSTITATERGRRWEVRRDQRSNQKWRS